MIKHTLKSAAKAAAITSVLAAPAIAGEPVVAQAPAADCGDWCETLTSIGTVYKDSSNPYVQQLKFFGRYQYQVAQINGSDVDGDSFNENFTEHRRARLGAELKFLNTFKLKGNINMVSDGRPGGGDLNWGYQSFDELKLSWDAKKQFDLGGVDKLGVTYGRQKWTLSAEAHESSKSIKTVERSAISNKVYASARGTGVTVNAAKGAWSGAASVYSTTESDDLAGWNDGEMYLINLGYEFANGDELLFDYGYNNVDSNQDDLLDYKWATSIAYYMERGRFEFMANAIYGDNGDQGEDRDGSFYGLVLLPSYWLVEDTLEAVGRYSYSGSSESEGIRTNSRYFRRDHGADVNSGRGDSLHSIYAGVNWYLCGNASKVMLGVEYDNLSTPNGDADATTLWAAYRMYF
ncbi:porin [Persicirhabdus sediminis]|uniref:Porin n=1 Tax=Persicirhabdus sediminis TaxID=454144 RepID=A0A8J7MK60_9BACT|nr:porin [Persicirhabdus sediminis]MBK1792508.1 hypothetical protein [Persicirhabdus sediminis]